MYCCIHDLAFLPGNGMKRVGLPSVDVRDIAIKLKAGAYGGLAL